MPITLEPIDSCTLRAPYEYVDSHPEEWWKRADEIDYDAPLSSTGENAQSKLKKEFLRLARLWKEQTSAASSVASMVMHPAYLEIISYGDKVIPFILEDLRDKPSHWFIALRILAKTSPVAPEDAGNIKKMTEAWLAWGKANGKLD